MPLYLADQPEVDLLNDLLSIDYVVHLFVNDHEPAPADTVSAYLEATFSGYAPVPLVRADWTISPGEPGVARAPKQTWVVSVTGALQGIYGYYFTRADTGALRWVERWTVAQGVPFLMEHAGDQFDLTPRITLRSQP